jgi:hypothetical protein
MEVAKKNRARRLIKAFHQGEKSIFKNYAKDLVKDQCL